MPGNSPSDGKILFSFSAYHRPALRAGRYRLDASQTVQTTGPDGTIPRTVFKSMSREIEVTSERISLDPGLIAAMFPPKGSVGDFSNILPHIVLNRSTLPWERSPCEHGERPASGERGMAAGTTDGQGTVPQESAPWLALMLFDEADEIEVATTSLESLPDWKAEAAAPGEKPDDLVRLVRLSPKLLKARIPRLSELPALAHVRQATDESGASVGPEQAVLLGNRLPEPGGTSRVHLVSLEGLFDDNGDLRNHPVDGEGRLALVSLHEWRLTCHATMQYRLTKGRFRKLCTAGKVPNRLESKLEPIFEALPQTSSNFAKLLSKSIGEGDAAKFGSVLSTAAVFNTHSFRGLALNLDMGLLRLSPDRNYPILAEVLAEGNAILPYRFRQGSSLYSFYRGPFVPSPLDVTLPLPARTSDALLRYDPDVGMFDTSYAAAWELGRLLAISDTGLSSALYSWKRRNILHGRLTAVMPAISHLPHTGGYTGELAPPEPLTAVLERLQRLEGVPLCYLIPDQRMLPPESLRFFQIDPAWMDSLLDGAISLGRTTKRDRDHDAQHCVTPAIHERRAGSGVIMRSALVAGWPDLIVDAYGTVVPDSEVAPDSTLKRLRFVRLSPNLLLVLFDGIIKTLDLHLPGEVIHFGLDPRTDSSPKFTKTLRRNAAPFDEPKVVTVHFRADRVLDIASLTKRMINKLESTKERFTSARFALEMIDEGDRIRFSFKSQEKS